MDKKIELIKKYLKNKKEKIIVDLIIKDFDKSNFYIALVFNSKIEKFKVLFIPLDVMEEDKIDEYCCYQFVLIETVNYLLELINEEKRCSNESFRNRLSNTLNSYYIEINTHVNKKDYKFVTNQFIPKDWEFLFEVVVVLFEHCPNIVSELCNKLLVSFNSDVEMKKYQYSMDMDIFDDKLGMFENASINNVDYLEKVNDKYFAIVKNNIFVLEYNNYKKILNIYCSCESDENIDYLFSIILAIRKEAFKKFYKIMDNSLDMKKYYLCYGINDEAFKVIDNYDEKLLPIEMLKDGLIKIIDDGTNEFEEEIIAILKKNMSIDEVNKIIKTIYYDIKK